MIAAMENQKIEKYIKTVNIDQGKDNFADRENIQIFKTMIFQKKTYSNSWFYQVDYQAYLNIWRKMQLGKHSIDGLKDVEKIYQFTRGKTNLFVSVPFSKTQHCVLSTPAEIVAA